MASSSSTPIPGSHRSDDLNFSFSPSSPPTFPAFPILRSDISPHPSFNPLDGSNISPALYASPPSTHARIHSHALAHLGIPGPPLHQDAVMGGYDSEVSETETETEETLSARRARTRSSSTKRSANAMVNEPEDHQRRGPPLSDTPGGDCKSLCVRHQKMANGGTNLMLQKSIEMLGPNDQAAVNTMWSLFSSSSSARRLLILRGLLTIACPSQLSFLQDALTLEMRIDPLEVLPREVSLKVFGYLDAISLGRAAQVSRAWAGMADDDVLWRAMCEQHIERKCEKCGWGLPLLPSERRRKARARATEREESAAAVTELEHQHRVTTIGGSSVMSGLSLTAPNRPAPPQSITPLSFAAAPSSSSTAMAIDLPSRESRPSKRAKTESPGPSRSSTPVPTSPLIPSRVITRPWKSVYCERFAIERNWRKGLYTSSVLSGHTDSVTCLQVAEDLPHPNFPVLMTGSWDRSVRIWNLESGKEVGVIRGHTRGIRALQFDAVKLITGSMDSTLKIWNWRTGECLRTLRGHTDAVICLAYDKQILVSGSADSTIRVWDFGTGEVYALRGHREWVNAVTLWDSNTGYASTAHEGDLGRPANDPAIAKESSRGKFLFSASDDMTIRVWDLYTRECVRVLTGHVAQVQSLRVITADPVEIAPKSPSPELPSSPPLRSQGLPQPFFAAPGPSCVTTAALPTVDPAFQHATGTTNAHIATLPLLDFAGEKRPCIVSASLDNTIKVWDVETGTCQRTMFGHIEGVWDVAVDRLRVVSASHDRTLKIWDKESGRNLHTLVGHTSAVTAVTIQDAYVVSGGDDGNARVWRFS